MLYAHWSGRQSYSLLSIADKMVCTWRGALPSAGIDSESDYPYLAMESVCEKKREKKNRVVDIHDFIRVPFHNQTALMQAVAHVVREAGALRRAHPQSHLPDNLTSQGAWLIHILYIHTSLPRALITQAAHPPPCCSPPPAQCAVASS
jgi:hypothetical protein